MNPRYLLSVRSLTVAAPIRAPGASPVTRRVRGLALAALILVATASSRADPIGTAFTYQGFLETGGPPAPVDGDCDFRFGLWRDATSAMPADQVGTLQTFMDVQLNNGAFTITMDFGASAIDGSARWLEIEVCCPSTPPCTLEKLIPRVELKPVPHALALPGLYTTQEPANAAGITPPPNTKIHVGGHAVMSYDPAVGEAIFQATNGLRAGSVKIDSSLASNAAGPGSSAELVVTGDVLALKVDGETVDRWTAIGGSTFGDTPNRISGSPLNSVTAGIYGAVISGGGVPQYINQVTQDLGTIGGGQGNTAGGAASTVGGGSENGATGNVSTVCGGSNNVASGLYSTVGGGIQNTTSGQNSTAPGGELNEAAGNFSFAAGRRAKANHAGAFVWGDSTNADFASTAANQFLIRAGGGVGIGTASPASELDVAGDIHASGAIASGNSITIDGTSGSESISSSASLDLRTAAGRALRLENHATSPNVIGGFGGNNVTAGMFGATIGGGGEAGASNQVTQTWGTVGGGRGNQAGSFATIGGGGGNTASAFQSTVGGGVSNAASGSSSSVGGGDTNLASGLGSTVGGGSNNIASGIRSTVPGGYLNQAAGDYSLAAGRRAKGNHDGAFVFGDSTNADFASTGVNQFLIRASGGVGIGDASPDAQLDVEKASATVAIFNRLTNDGTIVELQQTGTTQGTISVSGTTVSYNAFTGSHYGWTDEAISRGTLVTLTGDNRRRTQDPGAEPTYGIAPSVRANDSKCLGAYLGLLEPSKAADAENPHQVMAVGNGDMWVVDTGRNIEPGQYLISSDVTGHAMLDDAERFPVGYVIARAAEGVDWAKVSETIDASAQGSRPLVLPGRKHRRISVFFESFERGIAAGAGKKLEELERRLDTLLLRNSELEKRINALEARDQRLVEAAKN